MAERRKRYASDDRVLKTRKQVYLRPKLFRLFTAEVFLSFDESESSLINSILESHYGRYTPSHIANLLQEYERINKEKTTNQ